MLYRKMYISTAIEPISEQLINSVLKVSRRNNTRDQLTGMLMAHDTKFFQLLEGPLDKLSACYQRILEDPRHKRVRTLALDPVETRMFADWSMGLTQLADLAPEAQSAVFSLYDMAQVQSAELEGDEKVARLIRSFLGSHGLNSARPGAARAS